MREERSAGAAGLGSGGAGAGCSAEVAGQRQLESCERQCSAPDSRMTMGNVKAQAGSEKEASKTTLNSTAAERGGS